MARAGQEGAFAGGYADAGRSSTAAKQFARGEARSRFTLWPAGSSPAPPPAKVSPERDLRDLEVRGAELAVSHDAPCRRRAAG